MEPRVKIWLESEGRIAFSTYRLRLLDLIAEHGSLSEAAEAMGLSYRRAWGKVRELEANLGDRLVESDVGGAGGGHSCLTPAGRALVERYRAFLAAAEQCVVAAFLWEFPGERAPAGPVVVGPTDSR